MTKARDLSLAAKAPIASPVFTGNVGLGTSSPDERLHVMESSAGNVTAHTESVIVAEANGNCYFSAIGTTGAGLLMANTVGNEIGRINYGFSGNIMQFYTNNAERIRLDADGLKFNGDTAAANALDDYEEGTFTPSGTGVNTSSSVGAYTKIGRVCHAQIWIEANGNTAGHLGGLPFVSGIGGANFLGVGSVGFQNGTVHSIMTTGNTGGWFMYASNNSAGQLTNGQQLHCSLTYLTV